MRDHPFAYAPILIGLTLLLGAAFAQIKSQIKPLPPQNVAVIEVLQ